MKNKMNNSKKNKIVLTVLLFAILLVATTSSFCMNEAESQAYWAYFSTIMKDIDWDPDGDGNPSYDEMFEIQGKAGQAFKTGDSSYIEPYMDKGSKRQSSSPKTGSSGAGNASATSSPQAAKIPQHTHEYTSEVTKEPTCVDEGENTYTCTGCGDTYTEPIEPTDEHKYKSGMTVSPNCVTPGEMTYTCEVCGDEYIEEIPATGKHEYVAETIAVPTCTEAGTCRYTCKACGDFYDESIPARGHDDGKWKTVQKPGIWFAGREELRCKRDNFLLDSMELPAKLPMWTMYALIGAGMAAIIFIIYLMFFRSGYNRRRR